MTQIEWTDETWNPVTGCTKVSAGCKNCYAERLWPKVEGARVKREGGAHIRPFTDLRMHPERLDAPLHWRTPRRVFVNSMSDLFHEDVPVTFIASVLGIAAACRQHTFQVLTKRPARMRELVQRGDFLDSYELSHQLHTHADIPWPPPNVWLGVSVEDQETADERIPLLLQTPAAVRFVSAEPLLGPVDIGMFLSRTNMPGLRTMPAFVDPLPGINWIIAGGESGPHARPALPDWFRALRDQCRAAGVAFFFKQWGEWRPRPRADGRASLPMTRVGKRAAGRTLDGREHSEFPA